MQEFRRRLIQQKLSNMSQTVTTRFGDGHYRVIKTLANNPAHIKQLCDQLELGTSIPPLTRVFGGFHHRMWRLVTDRNPYAVKQLAADIDLHDPAVVQHYNVTEVIAEAFARHGIAAIHALGIHNTYLQLIEDTGYLVYPWCQAWALEIGQVSENHAVTIARVLATMHRANIDVPGVSSHEFDVLPKDSIVELVDRACRHDIRQAGALHRELPSFIAIAEQQEAAIPKLEQHLVISHGDLDQKNVLWDASGQPLLIDWESARKLNPTYEIVLAALDWSGVTSEYNHGLCRKIMSAYRKAGGVFESEMLEAALHYVMGEWVYWLIYNIARAVDPNRELRELGGEQIELVLPTLFRLQTLNPTLLSMWRDDR